MRLLIDTQIFLWAISGDSRLGKRQRDHYLDEHNELHFSIASIWEILIKVGTGRLSLPEPAVDFILRQMDANSIAVLPIRSSHLRELENLPPVHRDPFDRMLAAQSRAEAMPMLSADQVFRQYGVGLI